MEKAELEELKEAWNKWNADCHPEDTLSWSEYVAERGINFDEEF